MPDDHEKISQDKQQHLFQFHLKVPVWDFGALIIPRNTLNVAADPKEVFKCHESKNCTECCVSIVREEKEQLPGWNDLCHLLEATEQLWAKLEDRELSQVQ